MKKNWNKTISLHFSSQLLDKRAQFLRTVSQNSMIFEKKNTQHTLASCNDLSGFILRVNLQSRYRPSFLLFLPALPWDHRCSPSLDTPDWISDWALTSQRTATIIVTSEVWGWFKGCRVMLSYLVAHVEGENDKREVVKKKPSSQAKRFSVLHKSRSHEHHQ